MTEQRSTKRLKTKNENVCGISHLIQELVVDDLKHKSEKKIDSNHDMIVDFQEERLASGIMSFRRKSNVQ